MKLAKSAVTYYTDVTGNPWSKFYDDLDEAMASDITTQTGDLWLIHSLMNVIIASGLSVNEFKVNKDAVKAAFDEEGRKLAGEFFTPILWAEELHNYMDKYIPNWRNTYNVWEGSCGSGNLIRTAGVVPDHLFASSLQDDDITLIRNTPELQGCHAFQLDFLSAVDNPNNFMEEFTAKLPEELQRVFKNNEPIVFLMNPPYKTGQANNTEVGRYMNGANPFYNNVDFAKPAYDLFYQFCFQVMNIVSYYKLTNCYYAVFGPLTWFTGAGANILLKEFEKTFEFVDGMCISAQEFSDTSDSILWGIGATIWKSRGGYDLMPAGFQYHKDILLDKKFIAPDGTIGCEGKVLYAPPREVINMGCTS